MIPDRSPNEEMVFPVRAPELVTAGETMVLGLPPSPGRLRHAASLELKIAGAESNVAIALSSLGLHVVWASLLGEDEPGQFVLDRIRAEGVDTSRVRRLQDAHTGLFLRERLATGTRNYYYRADSAASKLCPRAFDHEYFWEARFLHLTGVPPALSESCRDFIRWASDKAREMGVRVSFDVNYRARLWPSHEARSFMEGFLPEAGLTFVRGEEGEALWGRTGEELMEESDLEHASREERRA